MTRPSESQNEERLSAYLDNELSNDERRQVELQLAENAHLRELFEQLKLLHDDLQQLPTHAAPPQFASRVITRIKSGTDQIDPSQPARDAELAQPVNADQRGFRRGLAWAACVIAVALLVMLFEAPVKQTEVATAPTSPRQATEQETKEQRTQEADLGESLGRSNNKSAGSAGRPQSRIVPSLERYDSPDLAAQPSADPTPDDVEAEAYRDDAIAELADEESVEAISPAPSSRALKRQAGDEGVRLGPRGRQTAASSTLVVDVTDVQATEVQSRLEQLGLQVRRRALDQLSLATEFQVTEDRISVDQPQGSVIVLAIDGDVQQVMKSLNSFRVTRWQRNRRQPGSERFGAAPTREGEPARSAGALSTRADADGLERAEETAPELARQPVAANQVLLIMRIHDDPPPAP